ncbi:MAG: MarR family transcriptional regulator [Oscillospiraceae bacterium]|nr:MarR family transcriptional regulator [Oscillospiraceae bacterium]
MPKIMKTLNNISRCQSMYREKKVGAKDLYPNHYAFVLVICHTPGRTQEELARELCLDKSTVARALAHLEKCGYITRISNEKDKREYLVYPTEKMETLCGWVRQSNKEWNELMSVGVSADELEIFYGVLSRMEERAKLIMKELEGGE